jgi:stalled ribosome rescue protein Dom34
MPVLVWIDRDHARLLGFATQPPIEESVQSTIQQGELFLERIARRLEGASRVLIVGPGVSKYRLFAYIRETAPQIARKVVGCEPLDYFHDFQIRELAEKHLGVISNSSGL